MRPPRKPRGRAPAPPGRARPRRVRSAKGGKRPVALDDHVERLLRVPAEELEQRIDRSGNRVQVVVEQARSSRPRLDAPASRRGVHHAPRARAAGAAATRPQSPPKFTALAWRLCRSSSSGASAPSVTARTNGGSSSVLAGGVDQGRDVLDRPCRHADDAAQRARLAQAPSTVA